MMSLNFQRRILRLASLLGLDLGRYQEVEVFSINRPSCFVMLIQLGVNNLNLQPDKMDKVLQESLEKWELFQITQFSSSLIIDMRYHIQQN